jgi:hypothetical protein
MNQMRETEWINKLLEIKIRYTESDISLRTKLLEGSHSISVVPYNTYRQL